MSLNSYDIAYNNLKKYLEKDILLYASQRNYDFGPEKGIMFLICQNL